MATLPELIDAFAAKGKVLLIGGLAVIAHGLTRTTKDGDIWYEPKNSAAEWADDALQVMKDFHQCSFYDLAGKRRIPAERLLEIVESSGVVRVVGLDMDLDVFRIPHNMDAEDFEGAWRRSLPCKGSYRLMDEVDLALTKFDTGRSLDISDSSFLEGKANDKFGVIAASADFDTVRSLLDRIENHILLAKALENPDEAVVKLAIERLKVMADEGNPFAEEILAAFVTRKEAQPCDWDSRQS